MFSLSLLHIWGLLWSTKDLAARKGSLTVRWIALYHRKTALRKGRKDLSHLWDDQLTQELKEYGQDVELAQAVILGESRRTPRKWGINVDYFWNFLLWHCLHFQVQLVMSVQGGFDEFSKPMARSSPTQKWHPLMASQKKLPSLPLMPHGDWKTIGVSLVGCRPKHPIVSETMCMSLKHGRAVLSLAPWDNFSLPITISFPPPPCQVPPEVDALYNIHCSPAGLVLFVLISILIITINPRGVGEGSYQAACQSKANGISLLQGVSCPSIKGNTKRETLKGWTL